MAFVEGMVNLQLDVKLSALGSVLTSDLGGLPVEIRLPRLPAADSQSSELDQPHMEYVGPGESLRNWIDGSPAWGKWYVMSADRSDGAAAVRQVGLVLTVPDELPTDEREAVAATAYGAVDDWCALVLDWLEVGFGQRLRRASIRVSRAGEAIQPWLWSCDGQERVLLHKRGTIQALGSHGERALDEAALQRVFTHAATGQSPSLSWLLTRDAENLLARGDYRRAVLDAGTAAELALSKLLTDRGIAIDPRDTLGSLVRKALNNGLPCPPDAPSDLVQVRNDAAHRGRVVDSEAGTAVQISADLVELSQPRATLLA